MVKIASNSEGESTARRTSVPATVPLLVTVKVTVTTGSCSLRKGVFIIRRNAVEVGMYLPGVEGRAGSDGLTSSASGGTADLQVRVVERRVREPEAELEARRDVSLYD